MMGASTPEAMEARHAAARAVGYEFLDFKAFFALNSIDWRNPQPVFNRPTLWEIDQQILKLAKEQKNG
jgi:hypothetical protein